MAVNPKPTGLVMDPRFLAHDTGDAHPENAGRLQGVYDMLKCSELLSECRLVKPHPCPQSALSLVHAAGYIKKIAATACRPFSSLAADMPVSANSYLAARLAVGGLLQAVREVWEGRLANAFALVRPPGHHAEAARAMGYCLFNNVAIAAMFARRELNARRVLIVDWDVHHGNGTQHAFERDPSVLFFSSHQHPHFPGTGLFTETGLGPGEGYSREARRQILEREGRLPKRVYACVGGGSNAMGLFSGFLDDPVELVGVEAGGKGLDSGRHASRLCSADASVGVAQGYLTFFMQDSDGQMRETHSISAGLDYVGVSTILAQFKHSGRARFEAATDAEVLDALTLTMRKEGLIPALESAHAFARAFKEVPEMAADDIVIINQSGRGDKDIFTIAEALQDPAWRDFIKHKAEQYDA